MKVLISAFESFDGRSINISEEVLKLLSDDYYKALIPVSYNKCFCVLKEKINSINPDIIICLGEAIKREDITIEKRAINLRNASIPDNEGIKYENEIIIDGRDEYLYSTLPIEAIISNTNIKESNSAGTYVCNNLLYELLNYNKSLNNNKLCGFIHLPRLEKYKSYNELKEQIEKCIDIIMEE